MSRHKDLKLAQDVLPQYSGGGGGFNSRVLGENYADYVAYPARRSGAEIAGFMLAEKMIEEGRIFSVRPFRHKWGDDICKGHAFPYGGTWVCNTCENSNLDQDWWTIKVYKDGNAWCCVGAGFEDLQASDNYAFGSTREEAISEYEAKILGVKP